MATAQCVAATAGRWQLSVRHQELASVDVQVTQYPCLAESCITLPATHHRRCSPPAPSCFSSVRLSAGTQGGVAGMHRREAAAASNSCSPLECALAPPTPHCGTSNPGAAQPRKQRSASPAPSHCRKAMGAALAAGVADQAQEVHDRALLYYRQALGWRLLQVPRHAGGVSWLTGIKVASTA